MAQPKTHTIFACVFESFPKLLQNPHKDTLAKFLLNLSWKLVEKPQKMLALFFLSLVTDFLRVFHQDFPHFAAVGVCVCVDPLSKPFLASVCVASSLPH